MDNSNIFGSNLQQIRKAKGLTQAKLAELAGVHEKHISKLELGVYMPSFNTLNKILKVLKVDMNDIGFDSEKTSAMSSRFYIKSMQILNSASEQELKFYYGLLKQGQKGIEIFNRKQNIERN